MKSLKCSSPCKERWKKESRGGKFNNNFEITHEIELKIRDQQLEDELQRREEKFETELRRKEQKFEKELQRRENRFEAESRRREQEWEEKLKKKEEQMKGLLKQQGEDFKKEMKERDRDLLQEIKLSHEAFYNNQFECDSQLLTLLKEKETEQDTRWGGNSSMESKVCAEFYKENSKRS